MTVPHPGGYPDAFSSPLLRGYSVGDGAITSPGVLNYRLWALRESDSRFILPSPQPPTHSGWLAGLLAHSSVSLCVVYI